MPQLLFPQPQTVFRHFAAISAIPHGSGNTAAIHAYCRDLAQSLGLDTQSDDAGNLMIRKPASEGAENAPRVIIQGHLDMVCAKLPECQKNMETEGLDLRTQGDFLYAEGTTLGGDDGIAIAYALALLEDKTTVHPPLTVLLTNDEEVGMTGASALEAAAVDGKYLLNIDSEEEGVFTVGCAGGVRVDLTLPVPMEMTDGLCCTLRLSGLQGGHSGVEIHRPLLNANHGMSKLLFAIPCPIRLSAWHGGEKDNVITSEAVVSFFAEPHWKSETETAITNAFQELRSQYSEETECHITFSWSSLAAPALSEADTATVIRCQAALPQGVREWDNELALPRTSLNQGITTLDANGLHNTVSVRSLVNAERDALADSLIAHAKTFGGDGTCHSAYPAWEHQPHSTLEQLACAAYAACYDGKQPQLQTIHAGLECGILCSKCEGLQAISFGPDIFDIHSPRERLSISSAVRTWHLLLRLLADLAQKG